MKAVQVWEGDGFGPNELPEKRFYVKFNFTIRNGQLRGYAKFEPDDSDGFSNIQDPVYYSKDDAKHLLNLVKKYGSSSKLKEGAWSEIAMVEETNGFHPGV